MAQYWDDFTANDIGTAPAGWTSRTNSLALEVVADAEATGGKSLKIGPGSALVLISFVSFDAVTSDANRADFEVLVRSRATTANSNGQNLCGAAGRVFTTSTATSGFNGYTAGRRFTGWRDRLISTVSGGTVTILGTTAGTTVDAEVYAFGRFRVSGTTLKYRSWGGALEDEPTTWEVETTNSTHSGAGWVGIWRNLLTNDVHVDFVGVGTGGDAAPSGPVGGNTGSSADPGNIAISGSSATGVKASISSADSGNVAISGSVASGIRSLVSIATAASIAIAGFSAEGVYTPTGSTVSSAGSGTVAISGAPANGVQTHISSADPGTIAILGSDANAATGYATTAEPGTVAITGADATASRTYVATASPTSVAISGSPAFASKSGGSSTSSGISLIFGKVILHL